MQCWTTPPPPPSPSPLTSTYSYTFLTLSKRVKPNSSFSSSGYISRRPARINFRTAIIQSISLWFTLICWEADIMSYADDNTPYVCSENVGVTLEILEEVGKVLFEWFSNNLLKGNADKCHLILSKDEPFSINKIMRWLKVVTTKNC